MLLPYHRFLIFIEDLADKVVAAVEPQRDHLDAAIVFPPCPGDATDKMGSFSMAQLGQPKSARPIHVSAKRSLGLHSRMEC